MFWSCRVEALVVILSTVPLLHLLQPKRKRRKRGHATDVYWRDWDRKWQANARNDYNLKKAITEKEKKCLSLMHLEGKLISMEKEWKWLLSNFVDKSLKPEFAWVLCKYAWFSSRICFNLANVANSHQLTFCITFLRSSTNAFTLCLVASAAWWPQLQSNACTRHP